MDGVKIMQRPTPLRPPQVVDLLRATAATVRAEVQALPPVATEWHPGPREWCVKEVLGHLIEAERRGFAGRIRTILEKGGPIKNWDQVKVARARRDCRRPPGAVLGEFLEVRAASIRLVGGLRRSELQRRGHHPTVGYLSVEDLLHEWVHHDRNHVRQLLANLQAFAWPHMGNAQKFSRPVPGRLPQPHRRRAPLRAAR
jgi:hypothetical protein